MEIDRLGFVHENYFYGDAPTNLGKLIYEVSIFFYMRVPDDFSTFSYSFTEDGSKEHLRWVSVNDDITINEKKTKANNRLIIICGIIIVIIIIFMIIKNIKKANEK